MITTVCHIRRNDEVNITHCGCSTEYDITITDDPIRVGVRDVAIFPDVTYPDNAAHCNACVTAYYDLCERI